MELTPYWKLKLNDEDFAELLRICIGYDDGEEHLGTMAQNIDFKTPENYKYNHSKEALENLETRINNLSIKSNVETGDYTTIEEVFAFLRKNKEATVEGALLGDFLHQDDEEPFNWEYWCKKDIENRFEKGIGDY